MRLSTKALGDLPRSVAQPAYDPSAQAVGIVHFGIGAFHRAHQAWYTDAAMNRGERDWSIVGVSLRSAGVAQQMNPQQGLYALAERSGEGTQIRVVGSVGKVIVASEDAEAVVAAVAAPSTRIVSLTVTEKGYCRAGSGDLDFDLAGRASFYHFVAQGLSRRQRDGLPGLTLLSCDNLPDNGGTLRALMRQYLERHDPQLVAWFDAECAAPSTMVDRIVPATTDDDRAMIAVALGGLSDEACVVTEPFSQWVIEDRFAGPRPGWESVGAQVVANIEPYETAKLRMLNGAHSMLAYCGLAHGHTYVHQAIADPVLRALAERLMHEEAAPTITPAPGHDLGAYADALIARFANPALNHRLIQIAMDGSQKIPQRWLETLSANAAQGRACPAILTAIAAWIRHLRGANGPVDDPRAADLARAVATSEPVTALFGGGLFDGWRPTAPDIAAINRALSAMSPAKDGMA